MTSVQKRHLDLRPSLRILPQNELASQSTRKSFRIEGTQLLVALVIVVELKVLKPCVFVLLFVLQPLMSMAKPVRIENEKEGTADWWLKNPSRAHEIEGFASHTSVSSGESISFFVKTTSANYTWELFRLGYYAGAGARQVLAGKVEKAVSQSACDEDASTGLVDCDWKESFSIQTSVRWVSGVYLVRLTTKDTNKDSLILFVVRDDQRAADMVYTHSVTTDLAYNPWGGHHLYNGAVKVSLNRPVAPPPYSHDQNPVGTGYFFAYYDYNMLRWLEKEGYNVKYVTNLDVHEDVHRVDTSPIFLSVGHDEYWSGQMRSHLNTLRDDGKSILFFSSNTMYWQVRFEPDARGNKNRIMVCYKNAKADPEPIARNKTVRFRDAPVFYPEDEFLGVLTDGDFPMNSDMTIRDASHWVFAGTGLKDGGVIPRILGFETDRMRWSAPKGTQRLASTRYIGPHGGPNHSDMTIYTTEKGGIVFAPGTMQWIWGLDDFKVSDNTRRGFENTAVQTISRNLIDRGLCSIEALKPYPTDKVLLDLRFEDALGSTHFKDSSAYDRSVLCIQPNCPSLLPGFVAGQALSFSSQNQFVDLGIEPSVRGKTGFYVEFSIRVAEEAGAFVVLQQRDDQSTGDNRGYDGSYQVAIESSGELTFWTYSRANDFALSLRSKQNLKDGRWHKVLVKRLNSGEGLIQIDGVEVDRKVSAKIDDLKPHTVFLGHDPMAKLGFVGEIADLKISML